MSGKKVELLVVEDYSGNSSQLEAELLRLIVEAGGAEVSVVKLHVPIWIQEKNDVVGVHVVERPTVAEA
ncbi:hypothetical protein GCM10007116_08610 [Sulfodiicoccus acidiphilus]|nr:hypothetical protein [Sulfodiicoccus acidiphilus]GGT93227.1 hypothetical protein GCM10007116_08610 [Sulfodiicoccus acidiphilus]